MTIFKACDIRGPYGRALRDEHATSLGHAISALLGPREVIVAGDGRRSTPVLKQRLIDALLESGCHVLDLGIVPTPVFYFARHRLGIATGVMVTASHNPPDHNGFKIALGDLPITPLEMRQLQEMMEQRIRAPAASGELEPRDVLPDYLDAMRKKVEACNGMRVVVDYGNGMGAMTGPLWRICCRIPSAISSKPSRRHLRQRSRRHARSWRKRACQ